MDDWTEDAGMEAVVADKGEAADPPAVEVDVNAEAGTGQASTADAAEPAETAVSAAKAIVPERLSRPGHGATDTQQSERSSADEGVIGPDEAAPHWRAFYGAIRDAVQGMRSGEKAE
ncbi:hypothetical protein [Paenibacillus montanisoli]|uniref:Uncharacterized protein n=1 Tax=Paenibacillus montanisoli TaxID=2081970 RepID=A0A328U7T8_9BACL|nr:hypothetical protein [Paenibacillus montanisoli]RAP77461.1 hypothetical protein DL346_02995 [Paenibacillus montanisoli]